MFLHHLNERQKGQVVVLAHQLAMADGEDAQEEEDILRALKQEAGVASVDSAQVLAPIDVSAFDSRGARVAGTLDLLVLAFSDEYLDPEETHFLGRLAGAMGFRQEQFDELVGWAYDYGQATLHSDAAAREALQARAAEMIAGT